MNHYLSTEHPRGINFFDENPITQDLEIKLSNYQGVHMTGATIKNSIFSESNFRNGEIKNCHLQGGKIHVCYFDDALFSGTTFEQIRFLKGTAFRARFKDCEFKRMVSRGIDLSESKSLGTKIYRSRMNFCCFSGSTLSHTDIDTVRLRNCQLNGCTIDTFKMINGLIQHSSFNGSSLMNGYFQDCDFQETSFMNTELDFISFENCRFTGCNLSRTKIHHCQFTDIEYDETTTWPGNFQPPSSVKLAR